MNRLNMQNEENAVIRYLMKEMDPSEEVIMERAMMEDDDLLIEVESMRQTLQRLDDLPEKEPSADLSKSIIEQAARHKQQTRSWPSIPSEAYKYAAVLIIGMGLGSGLWMFLSPSSAENTSLNNEAAVSASIESTSASNADADPWVDRNKVLYYQDKFSGNGSGYNSILETSMNKLTPVNDQSLRTNPNARNVQLTGSNN